MAINRRKLFGWLAAAPAVGLVAKEALASKPSAPVGQTLVGELRACGNFESVDTVIWDGIAWVRPDSPEGIAAQDAALRARLA